MRVGDGAGPGGKAGGGGAQPTKAARVRTARMENKDRMAKTRGKSHLAVTTAIYPAA
jgi:hypothetical protein